LTTLYLVGIKKSPTNFNYHCTVSILMLIYLYLRILA
jgi:hypothetical protein